VDDAEGVDLPGRGAELRYHPSLSAGANVNFISPNGQRWRMRTYERGVEGETLACGTGSAACAILLAAWGLTPGPSVQLLSTSGRILTVTIQNESGAARPSLRGEGRLVYEGTTVDL
jgi:diaminopimelate epimerase